MKTMKRIKTSIKFISFIAMGTLLVFALSCKKKDSNTTNSTNTTPVAGTVTDYDGNTYKTISIGTQVWMTQNLKVKHYNNGTAITYSAGSVSTGAYCYYATFDTAKYGLFYNFYAISGGTLAPTGWHVPTSADWTTLINYLGGTSAAGGALKESGTSDWMAPNTGATNSSSFNALPGGYSNGTMNDITQDGNFWSSTASGSSASYLYLYYGSASASLSVGPQTMGLSVRCVKD
jgi:uncharacterized protein (TIGR02145 family)